MKNLTSFFIQSINVVFLLITLSSCGKSEMEPVETFDCNTDALQLTTETFLDASIAYSNDASLENCKAYKAAAEAYLVNVRKCTLSSVNGIQETEELIESLDC